VPIQQVFVPTDHAPQYGVIVRTNTGIQSALSSYTWTLLYTKHRCIRIHFHMIHI